MRQSLAVVALALALVVRAAGALQPGDYTRGVEVGGRRRTYLVHVPPGTSAAPLPVVIALHGGLSNGAGMARFSGLSDKADRSGFIAVYPNGTGRLPRALTWNAGNCCGYAESQHVDDVAFVRAMLDDLGAATPVDARRIYATGISNGGMMAYRLAAELSERIAAIAPVSGPMGTESCHPSRPLSVLHFHGTADPFAPFAGGRGARSLSSINLYSVEHSLRAWIAADGCPAEPLVTGLPVRVDDGTQVTRKTYGPCREGAEVVLLMIENGGHTWPGRQPPVRFLGKATANVDANDAMWDFFAKHPLPATAAARAHPAGER